MWADRILGKQGESGKREEADQGGSWAERLLGPISPSQPDANPQDPPDPHIQQVDIGGGQTIPVYNTRAKVVSAYINGKPVYGESFKEATNRPPMASVSTIRSVSRTNDPQVKMRLFAEGRGEGDQVGERYGILPDGGVVRKADDGVWYREIPKTPGGGLRGFVGEMTNPIDAATTIASGAAMSLPVVGIPVAGAIEYGGEVVKRARARGDLKKIPVVGKIMPEGLGEKGSASDAYIVGPSVRAAVAMGAGALSTMGSKAAVRGGNKLARGVGRTGEVGRIVKNAEKVDRAGIKKRVARFERFDLQDNVGAVPVTKSPRLAATEAYIRSGRAGVEAKTTVEGMDAGVKADIRSAMKEGKGGLPKTVGPESSAHIGGAIRQATQEAKETLYKRRKAATQPLYAASFKEAKGKPIDVEYTMELVKDRIEKAADPKETSFWKSVQASFYKKTKAGKVLGPDGKPVQPGGKVLKSDIEDLDRLQKSLRRRMSNVQDREKYGTVVDELGDVHKSLMDDIGTASPTYGKATKKYAEWSEIIRREEGKLKMSLLERLSGMGKDEVHKAPEMLFGDNVSPQTIRNVKDAIIRQTKNGQRKWDTISRGAMTHVVEGMEKNLDIPERTLMNLHEIVPDAQYKAVLSFRDALRDIGYGPKRGATRSMGGGWGLLEQEVGGMIPKGVRKLTISPYIWSKIIIENRIRKAAPRIAKELSTGEGVRNMLALRQMPPGVEKTARVLGYLGLQMTYGAKIKKEAEK
jgi:hypothetical protein